MTCYPGWKRLEESSADWIGGRGGGGRKEKKTGRPKKSCLFKSLVISQKTTSKGRAKGGEEDEVTFLVGGKGNFRHFQKDVGKLNGIPFRGKIT